MRVISQPPEMKPWSFTCYICSAVLEASESDIRYRMVERGGNIRDSYKSKQYCVRCPVCLTIRDIEVPKGWAATHEVPAL